MPQLAQSVTALASIPFVIAHYQNGRPLVYLELMRPAYPSITGTLLYRYLQIWKSRNRIELVKVHSVWRLTPLGSDITEKIVAREGWPQWMHEHNIAYWDPEVPPVKLDLPKIESRFNPDGTPKE